MQEAAAAAESLNTSCSWQSTILPNFLGSSYTHKLEGIIKKASIAFW